MRCTNASAAAPRFRRRRLSAASARSTWPPATRRSWRGRARTGRCWRARSSRCRHTSACCRRRFTRPGTTRRSRPQLPLSPVPRFPPCPRPRGTRMPLLLGSRRRSRSGVSGSSSRAAALMRRRTTPTAAACRHRPHSPLRVCPASATLCRRSASWVARCRRCTDRLCSTGRTQGDPTMLCSELVTSPSRLVSSRPTASAFVQQYPPPPRNDSHNFLPPHTIPPARRGFAVSQRAVTFPPLCCEVLSYLDEPSFETRKSAATFCRHKEPKMNPARFPLLFFLPPTSFCPPPLIFPRECRRTETANAVHWTRF
eukprot:Rhum_TRINITY_DN14912_c4_g1::Rhum_TRINITY_DN14912_c4_g1_i1::g.128183::m.128183